ncbi:MAG: hypothetical protein JWP89_4897 [Schlesneria sp.]|nr:hypothetical protein [Schlesneria sp.]
MREIRQSGSEGGASQSNETFLPLSVHMPRPAQMNLRRDCTRPLKSRMPQLLLFGRAEVNQPCHWLAVFGQPVQFPRGRPSQSLITSFTLLLSSSRVARYLLMG